MRNRFAVLLASAGFALTLAPSALRAQAPVDVAAEPDVAISTDQPASASRIQVNAEYLLWWVKDAHVPAPLVTTGSPTDAHPGAIGMPGTVVLLGDSIDYRGHSGGRLTADGWLDDEQTFGVEGSGFVIETHTFHFGIDSDRSGSPVIARPFFSTLADEERAQIITAPGVSLGGIDVFSDSRLWGAEANFLAGIYRAEAFRADLLAGFRFLSLGENIRISQSSTLLAPGRAGFFGVPVPPPDIVSLTDRLSATNAFYAGQLGFRGEYRTGRFLVDLFGKVALGSNHETYSVFGKTQQTDSERVTLTGPGGLYALASNSGLTFRDRFAVAPEVGISVGFQVTPCVIARLGYSLLYWEDAARPGDEINPNLDPRQIPSNTHFVTTSEPLQPVRLQGQSDYWAQGLTCGLEIRF